MTKNQYASDMIGPFVPLIAEDNTSIYSQPTNELSQPQASVLLTLIDQLSRVPVDPYGGYGWFDAQGSARYGSWQAWVTKPQIMVKKPGTLDFYTWKDTFSVSFVDASMIHRLLVQVNQLLKFIPPDRCVYHGNLRPENIYWNETGIVGIKDWSQAGYGDFLYDVACFDFWVDTIPFVDLARNYYQLHGKAVPHYFERIHAHQLLCGLTELGKAAAKGVEEEYESIIARLQTKQLL